TNLSTALETLTRFYTKYSTLFPNRPSIQTLQTAISATKWPGRMEFIFPKSIHPHNLLTDGAHNEQGAKCLREYIDNTLLKRYKSQTVHWILGMKKDLDKMQQVLKVLVRPGDIIWTVGFESPVGMPWIKALEGREIEKGVQALGFGNHVVVFDGVLEVLGELEKVLEGKGVNENLHV
ncbi:UNVERIFIED_CONTAM: folylpolyglutamate synthase, partial [Siphonaria sp. JEL0065]